MTFAIQFTSHVPVEHTMFFEDAFSESLALSLQDKREALKTAIARWMYVGSRLVGETYGYRMQDVDEPIPGVTDEDNRLDPRWDPVRDCYLYSTGIAETFQGMGYGKILKAHFLGVLAAMGFRNVVGHARKNGSLQLNQRFGAEVLSEHSDWFDSGETYWLYRIAL